MEEGSGFKSRQGKLPDVIAKITSMAEDTDPNVRLYLAFREGDDAAPEGFLATMQRVLSGAYNHAEICFEMDGLWLRATVFARSETHLSDLVFRTASDYKNGDGRWTFLRIPATHEQKIAVDAEVRAMIARGERYSAQAKYRAALPWFPGGGEGVYCVSMAMRALQAAGFLRGYPAEHTSVGELFLLAQLRLQAYVEPDPTGSVRVIDASNLTVSRKRALDV